MNALDTTLSPAQTRKLLQRKKKRKEILHSGIYHVSVCLLGLFMLYPLLWMFASSLKEPADIWDNAASLIPKVVVFRNYLTGWQGFGGITFATFFKNSFFYAGVATLGNVLSSALIAYGFARIRFFGRGFWFAVMLMTIMLPQQVLLIPQYIVFSKLGWLNTFKPLLIPRFFGHPFFTFLMVQFIRGIPQELDEAAEIDGCSKAGIFFRIILPLIQPALITAGIFSFYWTWEDFLRPLVYLNDPKLYTISMALRLFADPGTTTDWGAVFAMLTLSLVPVFIIFVSCQRYIIKGISTTGLKG
jgi:multiple sugar transport system permease protein